MHTVQYCQFGPRRLYLSTVVRRAISTYYVLSSHIPLGFDKVEAIVIDMRSSRGSVTVVVLMANCDFEVLLRTGNQA